MVLVVGALFVVRGSIPLVRARRWSARACQATGRVIDHVRLSGHKPIDAPLVEFDIGESHVRFVGTEFGRECRPLGTSVPVLYDPADPGHARLADLKTAPSWWLIVGMVAVIAAIAVT